MECRIYTISYVLPESLDRLGYAENLLGLDCSKGWYNCVEVISSSLIDEVIINTLDFK